MVVSVLYGRRDPLIFEALDAKTALSIVPGAITPGHLKVTRTTELFTMQEMNGALQAAGGVHDQGPQR